VNPCICVVSGLVVTILTAMYLNNGNAVWTNSQYASPALSIPVAQCAVTGKVCCLCHYLNTEWFKMQ